MSDEQSTEQTQRRRRVSTPGGDAKPAVVPAAVVDDGLPNAIDIDPRAITGPVLTRQGWVVPDAEYIAKQRKLAALQAEMAKG